MPEYTIATHRLPGLKKKVEALARREAKLTGAGTIAFEIVAECSLFRYHYPEEPFAISKPKRVTIGTPAAVVSVVGDPPRLPGWTFAGVVEPLGEVNLVVNTPGSEDVDLEEFRTGDLRCDHCGTVRRRTRCFVVRDDATGDAKLVGTNCLADFTGFADPKNAAKWAELYRDVERFVTDEFEKEPRGKPTYDLAFYLAIVAKLSRESGFVTKKAANESGGMATAWDAENAYHKLVYGPNDGRNRIEPPTTDDVNLAVRAIEWARAIEVKSDFDHNLKAIADAGEVPWKRTGIAAYLITAMKRENERAAERERRIAKTKAAAEERASRSEHVGEEGKRMELTLTLRRVIELEPGAYGATWIHKFEDADENEVTWFASNSYVVDYIDADGEKGKRPWEAGETLTVKATVKRHTEYKGVAETHVNRVKVVEPVKTTGAAAA
jgi:hypothetical protein